MPITPSSTAWRHWSSVRSSKLPTALGPTALTSTLSFPFHLSANSVNSFSTASTSPTSATIPMASGLPRRVSSSAAWSRTARDRPTTATRAPSSAKHRAVANPMPRPPPTTTAVASLSPKSMVLQLKSNRNQRGPNRVSSRSADIYQNPYYIGYRNKTSQTEVAHRGKAGHRRQAPATRARFDQPRRHHRRRLRTRGRGLRRQLEHAAAGQAPRRGRDEYLLVFPQERRPPQCNGRSCAAQVHVRHPVRRGRQLARVAAQSRPHDAQDLPE